MIPPRGFKAEQYPLRHRLIYSCGLDVSADTVNTVFLPIIMSSEDMDTEATAIIVNPHNELYVEDAGPLCRQMSIIDRLRISLKFNMTEANYPLHETAAGVFSGDGLESFHFLWRPIFGSFDEKLNATDDDTSVTVAAMLGLTVDATQKDVVALTTNKLSVVGQSDLLHPLSTVNAAQVVGDFNYTSTAIMEDHVWDEDLFQAMLRRSTVKGALRSFVGRTRHVTLSKNRPFQNVFINKFLPRAVRRMVPFSFFGIQIHLPFQTDVEQTYMATNALTSPNLGIKVIANYHEWNPEHEQGMGSQV